jgi:hypothetical protein
MRVEALLPHEVHGAPYRFETGKKGGGRGRGVAGGRRGRGRRK